MALIHCPECQKEVSDKAVACIHCGYPLTTSYRVIDKRVQSVETPASSQEQSKKGIGTFGIVVIVIAILGLLGSCVSNCGGSPSSRANSNDGKCDICGKSSYSKLSDGNEYCNTHYKKALDYYTN